MSIFPFPVPWKTLSLKLDVPVEVRNPASNFDILGKYFVEGFWSAKSKI
jgi:hypothetical protein